MIRRFHTSARVLKNPYYFYDLQRKQGPPRVSQAKGPSKVRSFDPLANASKETMQQRVRKVFGEMGSREESRKEAIASGINVAGVHVPKRPEEPTNCCMSGCINCVWEMYKDELDEYKQLRSQARKKLSRPEFNHIKWPIQLGSEPESRHHDSDQAHKEVQNAEEEDNDDELSPGIKAFIETERKIHARKQAQELRKEKQSEQTA